MFRTLRAKSIFRSISAIKCANQQSFVSFSRANFSKKDDFATPDFSASLYDNSNSIEKGMNDEENQYDVL